MASASLNIHILLLSMILSGISTQNVPVTTTTQAPPTPNTTVAPPKTECKLTPTKPAQQTQKYVLFEGQNGTTGANGTVCLLAEFNSAIFINGTTPAQYLNLGKGTVDTQNSTCSSASGKALLAVNFECGKLFINVEGNQTVSAKSIHGFYIEGNSTSNHPFHHDSEVFKTTKAGFYYRCNSDQYVHLDMTMQVPPGSTDPLPTGVFLLVSNLGFDAFLTSASQDFYKPAEVCLLDSGPVNDLVPIAVGACLAALVVIVLIAYFVGRRRWSERSTYESV